MHIEQLLREQDEFALRVERRLATQDEGRGLEGTVICPHCERATVAVEHEYMPQLRLMLSDDEPSQEATWYACDWCGSELDPEQVKEATPRKPSSQGEPDDEYARRRPRSWKAA